MMVFAAPDLPYKRKNYLIYKKTLKKRAERENFLIFPSPAQELKKMLFYVRRAVPALKTDSSTLA